MRLPAVVAGGSALTSTGILAFRPSLTILITVGMVQLAGLGLYGLIELRRQRQSQQAAAKLVATMGRAGVVVPITLRANGEIQIGAGTGEAAPSVTAPTRRRRSGKPTSATSQSAPLRAVPPPSP
jgi:hypothetical protein